jgi:hypothetical protein
VALEVVDTDPGSALAVREVAVCRTNLARMVWAQDQESAIGQLELAGAGMELVCERLPGNGRFEAELQVVRESLDWCFSVWVGPRVRPQLGARVRPQPAGLRRFLADDR